MITVRCVQVEIRDLSDGYPTRPPDPNRPLASGATPQDRRWHVVRVACFFNNGASISDGPAAFEAAPDAQEGCNPIGGRRGGWDLGPPSSAAVGVGGASAGAPARLSDQREAAGFVQALTNSDTDGKYPLSIRSDGGGAMGRLGRLAASSSRPMNFVSPKFHQLSGDSR